MKERRGEGGKEKGEVKEGRRKERVKEGRRKER